LAYATSMPHLTMGRNINITAGLFSPEIYARFH